MDFSWIGVAIAPIGALTGVVLGTRLTSNLETKRWLRDQRLESYVHLLDLLTAINRHFAVGMRVNKFRLATAVAHGHDAESVDGEWMDRLNELEHLELTLALLGDRVQDTYEAEANDLITDYFDAVESDAVTEGEWDALVDRGRRLIEHLAAAARAELGVPRRRRARNRGA